MAITRVTMPRYGWTMTEGKIIQWLKKEGDYVKKGEPLLTIESEKIQIDLEADASGVLRKIIAEEGASVPVANLIAILADPSDDISRVEVSAPAQTTSEVVTVERGVESPVEEKIKIMPRARRLAEEKGVNIRQIKGTGPGGTITSQDVVQASMQPTGGPPTPPSTLKPPGRPLLFAGRRKFISDRMAQSSRTSARVTLATETDVTEAAEMLAQMRRQDPEITYTDFVARAVVKALKENPLLNSVWVGEIVYAADDVNLGIAVSSEEGLVVPVIQNSDKKTIPELARARKELVSRARQGKAFPQDFIGGTFTITNLGMFGVDYFTPIINPPENAILGIGEVREKPAVCEGKIQARVFMPLSLSFDHRVVDGAPAAIFLKRVREMLQTPKSLVS